MFYMSTVLPASAGMIHAGTATEGESSCAPRIRGDDPGQSVILKPELVCSPHPRG